ncbi:hypothetical protein [Agarilytica rhodophyticola]|uniref:hypothetical protein n=1 Tax=Agarilytica rhodophyticola TaxID=1737490 RepID=UPI001315A325|nr:hypothetical protein [Agarilytica rhodophyticola]
MPRLRGGMDKEFDRINMRARLKKIDDDHYDLNSERSGHENTGRIKRFGLENKTREEKQHKEEKRKLSELALLMQNPEYREAWTHAISTLNEADQAVYDALNLANEHLSKAQKEHDALQSEASKKKLEEAQAHYDHIQAHEQRLGDIREAFEDQNNPLSLDEIKAFTAEIQAIHADVSPKTESKQELEVTHVNPSAVPDLKL